jgi:type VI secretion system protein ImpL
MSALVHWLKSRWFLSLIGVLLLCLLAWFGGPYLGLGDSKPLLSPLSRLITVFIIVLLWALIWQWKNWQAARANRQLGEAAVNAGRGAAGGAMQASDDHPSVGGADAQLRSKFEEAFAALRKSNKGAKSLLELPWYIIIGPPGSGKTTVLSNSGLEFPLSDRFGKAAVRGIGGTRSCDWWFTSEAILLDTAGRYTTQESNRSADQAGWLEFLTLLKQRRRRRPINGVLLAFSMTDVATLTDEERERHVLTIQRRLAELHQHLGVQLPVYVLLTKVDLVAGFIEYFDDFDKRDREQVWGVTFPWELSRDGRAQERLAAELDELVSRLAARVPDRLQAERDLGRRAAVFAFPQQLAGLKAPMIALINGVFGNSALDERAWLRGVYLTSGTQAGTPIDRMLGALAKTFGLGVQTAAPVPGRGKAYFIERLLRDVVFREAGLAGSDRRIERRALLALSAAYLLILCVTVLLLVGMSWSYRSNRSYVEHVTATARPLKDVPRAGSNATLAHVVPGLDALRRVVDDAGQYRDHVPWDLRFGLYQGVTLWEKANHRYFAEMKTSLAPAVMRDLASRIEVSGADPDKLYEYLKAYLMLADPRKRMVPAQIQLVGHAEFARAFARDPDVGERVTAHFDAYTANPRELDPTPSDPVLVERARASLLQNSPALLAYSRVKLSYAGDTEHALHLDRELGVDAKSTLLRKSGKPLTEPLAGFYTRAVFDKFNVEVKPDLVARFMDDAWVFGDRALPVTQTTKFATDVLQLYERDYIQAWDALLGDITLRQPRDTAEAITLLGALSSPTSPFKRLLVITDANTNFSKPSLLNEAAAAATAKLPPAGGILDKITGGSTSPKPGAAITEHFAKTNAQVAGTPAPIDAVLAHMAQAQQKLQSASGLGGQPGSPQVLAEIQNALAVLETDAREMPPVIGGLIGGLTGQSKSVAMGSAHSDLESRYQSQVVTQCRELLGTRYPFNRNSTGDVTLQDFSAVFGPGGIYDVFFQANLAALVDTSRSTWRWKEGAEAIGGSTAMLTQFQAVEEVRRVFFKPGSQTPEFRFNVTADELDDGVDRIRLDLDGQSFEYHHNQPQPQGIIWPGGPVGKALATFEFANGQHPAISKEGPWALFRLLDEATVQAQSDTHFLVTLRVNGKQARLIIDAASTRNPFARRDTLRFRCS